MRDKFFPYFERWIDILLGQKGTSLPVSKHRMVAAVIGAAYRANVDVESLSEQQWTNIVEFLRKPQELSKKLGSDWPASKGRWDGQKGYRAQIDTVHRIVAAITAK